MKNPILLTVLCILAECQQKVTKTKESVDTRAELDKIAEMRTSFEQPVKANRYNELGKFDTTDLISIGP